MENQDKKKKIMLILMLLFLIGFMVWIFWPKNKSLPNNKNPDIKKPLMQKDVSDNNEFKITHNQLAKKYNSFCASYGVVSHNLPQYDKLFDLDNNGFDCDEKNEQNGNKKEKLISFVNPKSIEDKKEKPQIFDVVDQEKPKEEIKINSSTNKKIFTPKPVVIVSVIPNKSLPVRKEEKQELIQIPQQIIQNKVPTKKQQKENKVKQDIEFIINKLKSLENTSNNFKDIFNLNSSLIDLLPNLGIKINDLDLTKNQNILDKLKNINVDIELNGRLHHLNAVDIILTKTYKYTYNNNDFNNVQTKLYEKYINTQDVIKKHQIEKKLKMIGVDDVNLVMEVKNEPTTKS